LSTVDMAFQVPGRINFLVEHQGVIVPKGDLLASLEPQDYELALKQAEASYRKAKSDFERGKQLQNDNYISKSDFDSLQTAYENAELAVENARLNIDYTELHAPFDALITNRVVEKFSYVQSNQAVLRVQNINYLRIHVNVPEKLMRYVIDEKPEYRVYLETKEGDLLTDSDGKLIELSYLENKTEINDSTQTYQVTFKLPRKDGLDLLPGMVLTARVEINNSTVSAGIWVPMTAIDSTGQADFAVWRVDGDKVVYQPVDIGLIRDGQAQIISDLQGGTKLVAAGVGSLQDGMVIREFTKESPIL
ncbi:efflux RND transporter periplasmic adaptor subunit, partial [Alteromonas sp. 14N.309.X.WAT.G.H12]|uniref:efflux RND transporter periplasmic adaptor subunit n=1 Tax=Alteromonas sp. 14N.309.X.WAT.G.H12 TaxID=3120824 RepID=UPI002FD6900F